MSKVKDWPQELRGGRIGTGWYEESEKEIEARRLENIAMLRLKQTLDEIFVMAQHRRKEALNAVKEREKQKSY